MKRSLASFAALAAMAGGASAQGQVNVICSVQADWCNMIQTVFAKSTGIKVNMSLKGSGEALAQLIAEKANPKTDVWFGGTGDPHLQAAESDLTLEYKSADAAAAARLGAAAGASSRATRRSASTRGPLGFGYNTELIAKKKLRVPQELGRPAQARVQGRDPGREPGVERHRLHDGRDAGAADGRGQGLRLPEGAAQERRPVHALAAPARSRRWRAARRRCRSASCTTARARRCRASRSRPSRRPKAPAPRSAR